MGHRFFPTHSLCSKRRLCSLQPKPLASLLAGIALVNPASPGRTAPTPKAKASIRGSQGLPGLPAGENGLLWVLTTTGSKGVCGNWLHASGQCQALQSPATLPTCLQHWSYKWTKGLGECHLWYPGLNNIELLSEKAVLFSIYFNPSNDLEEKFEFGARMSSRPF